MNKIRRFANTKKVGHLGTLDPMATGVLPLVIGRATRLAQFFTAAQKSYVGTVRFGFATTTFDAEGEPLAPAQAVPDIDLAALFDRFRGTFAQTPPPVSAKKIGGVPAYKLARRDQPVELKAVEVTVSRLEAMLIAPGIVSIELDCSAGTYVRSIAHDAGVAAGCGAHLASLRRVRSGDFTLAQARTMDELGAMAEAGSFYDSVIPSAQLLPEIPSERVDDTTAAQIRNGREFHVSPFRARSGTLVKAISSAGELVAIGRVMLPNVYRPILVF